MPANIDLLHVVENYKKNHDGPKQIIVSFDGTGGAPSWGEQNEEPPIFSGATGLSNVCKMHLIAGGNVGNTHQEFDDQIALYYTGVGTRGYTGIGDQVYSSVLSGYAMMKVATVAAEDIKKLYHEGDQLFVFGFSRGAGVARLFCSYLNRDYPDVEVKFLGVYDTVVESFYFGVSESIACVDCDGKDTKMCKNVKNAVHFLSIDEERSPFIPTLFNKDDRVKEIWCPGNHSDIGGGYYHDGLSDIVLECMRMEAAKHGMKTREITEDLCKNAVHTLVATDNDLAKNLNVDAEKFANFDKDMEVKPDPLDPDRHSEMSSMYSFLNYVKGFKGRNIRVVENDETKEDEPILLLDSAVLRAKDLVLTDEEKGKLAESTAVANKNHKYRPFNLVGKRYKVVNHKDMSIGDKVFEGIEKEVADW